MPPDCAFISELRPTRIAAEGVGDTTVWRGGNIPCSDSSDEGLKELREETECQKFLELSECVMKQINLYLII